MTDDAYLFLADASAVHLGTALAAVGELECLETPAVRAWLDAHGVTAASPDVRVLPPEETGFIPEGAERLPVPLSEEETERVRRAAAPESVGRVEAELAAFRDSTEGRDALLRKALAAGVPAHRIVELTGIDPSTVAAASEA
ncbi:DUF6003 family protein [Streptomyces sp. SP18CS02]|uniref:DUF6003 family protein n=1 Tax=Streptomyces sp. SP18CS02 TaxID=3002531 RepID=UPI002E77F268|nr:DUF6003 family protein [Streptomyces sp. SP18CS02]MEE1754609.1 DUF6003 family protein [Streptomyces sp. SP18CS02]